jgi:ParB-like chromosome segregation protein Spo0J
MSQTDREEARQTYAILDGVRRAKAAWLLGNETINAQINGVGSTITLRLSNILSPLGQGGGRTQ